jgi:hypothetical protein
MNSKNANLALLVGLSFLWFFMGIGATVIFSLALGYYGEADGQTTPYMVISLISLIALPMLCAHTLIRGWRSFAVAEYPAIIKVVLLPFPLLGFVVIIFQYAWP